MDYSELKSGPNVPYAQTEQELMQRIRIQMADFLANEKRRFGPAYVQQNKDRLVGVYLTNAQNFEDSISPQIPTKIMSQRFRMMINFLSMY